MTQITFLHDFITLNNPIPFINLASKIIFDSPGIGTEEAELIKNDSKEYPSS